MSSTSENFLVGIFDDEDILLHGVEGIRGKGVKIHEVYTPFPVHGLDEALGYKRSRLPIAAFLFGLTGTSLALTMQIWMLGFDWPMIIGGKNFVSLPPFIPVTFELTVLLAALGMVATFFIVSDMKPYKTPRSYDIRSTDDKHVMAIDLAANKLSKEEIGQILKANGASEVNEKNF
ncbi:MAG: DUF3341 domain-containing protein [Cyclobacteriaceae bacterium]|nr:DUF3341 domain-containing protein [Cyclobacteriaceae bacterium]